MLRLRLFVLRRCEVIGIENLVQLAFAHLVDWSNDLSFSILLIFEKFDLGRLRCSAPSTWSCALPDKSLGLSPDSLSWLGLWMQDCLSLSFGFEGAMSFFFLRYSFRLVVFCWYSCSFFGFFNRFAFSSLNRVFIRWFKLFLIHSSNFLGAIPCSF